MTLQFRIALVIALAFPLATQSIDAASPAALKRTQFAGFVYYQTPSRVFPVRVVNGKTNVLAAKWQWRDMHPVISDPESTPRVAFVVKQPMTKDPLPSWELLDGKVKAVRDGMVSLEVERDIKETWIDRSDSGPANRFGAIGGFGGRAVDLPPSKVTRKVGTYMERISVANVPKNILPEVGTQFTAWARVVSETKYDFGLIPRADARKE